MKTNSHDLIPKENIDHNREKEDKIPNFKNSFAEEMRVFGKDIKNSQTNPLALNYPLIGAKNYDKGLMKNKINPKKEANLSQANNLNPLYKYKFNQEREEVNKKNALLERYELTQDDSDSLSQVIQDHELSNTQELKEYKDLALANENNLHKRKTHTENLNPPAETMVKVGNFFVKKSLSTNQSINVSYVNKASLNESFKNKNGVDKYDREVQQDPQYVVDFVKEIFADLKDSESLNAAQYGYMSTRQDDINEKMRAVLIDWLIDVHLKFKLVPETLYLTINLIDRYLNIVRIERGKLQLVAVAAMLIASKYEEIYAPEVRDFVYITDKSYSKNEILEMEYKILSNLNFDILQVNPYTFLRRYHFISGDNIKSFYLAQFILEFSLLEYKMLLYTSSIKAASSLYISRKLLKLDHPWPQTLATASYYQDKDLKLCVKDMCKILEFHPRITLKSCINKFSSAKYMEVAKINMFN